jgi:hypothetical protein
LFAYDRQYFGLQTGWVVTLQPLVPRSYFVTTRTQYRLLVHRCVQQLLTVLLVISTAGSQLFADEPSPREQAFSQKMQNCVLVGTFTVDGQTEGDPLKPERYEIESAVKAAGDLWVFTVRIKYGKLDTKLPVTVPLLWAGETPMVSLTDASIPGLGEGFSARVLFHDDRYAGTWQHGKVGGHMFGRIEKAKPKAASDASAQPAAPDKSKSAQ